MALIGRSFRKSRNRFKALFRNPFFWTMTAIGNSIILAESFFLWIFETDSQHPMEYIDCLLWSAGTVTTIGYGNYIPYSFNGKVTVLILMLLGTLFVWSYMAFLVSGLIAPEMASLEREMREVEKEVREHQGPT